MAYSHFEEGSETSLLLIKAEVLILTLLLGHFLFVIALTGFLTPF